MNPSLLLPAPILLPLVGAALTLLAHRRLAAQRTIAISVLTASLGVTVALLATVVRGGAVAAQAGGWEAPMGITLAADRFGALMAVIAVVMLLAVLVYAIGQLDPDVEELFFHPLYLVLAAGVSAAFLTGDLFNLFVAFEILLIASYVLLTLGAGRGQIRHGMTYVVINLVASTLFVVGVAYVYAATGSVNMADLAGRIGDLPPAIREALGLLFLVTFGIKAGLFPLYFWLPDSYPAAPPAVTAVFAGLLTKVGIYAIIRTQTLLFASDGPSTLLLFVAGATMLVGVLGAVSQGEIRRILSFHIVSQVGYMILGLGLFTVAGVAGAILYVVHHIVVKTTLFCVGGAVEQAYGTGRLASLGGVARRTPLLAGLFGIAALSLAGLPPFSGFVAKLSLTEAGLASGRWLVVAVGLLVSALTLFSMTKIWAGAFWGRPSATVAGDGVAARVAVPLPMLAATVALVALSLAIAVFAGPLWDFSQSAASELLDPSGYVRAVMGP